MEYYFCFGIKMCLKTCLARSVLFIIIIFFQCLYTSKLNCLWCFSCFQAIFCLSNNLNDTCCYKTLFSNIWNHAGWSHKITMTYLRKGYAQFSLRFLPMSGSTSGQCVCTCPKECRTRKHFNTCNITIVSALKCVDTIPDFLISLFATGLISKYGHSHILF